MKMLSSSEYIWKRIYLKPTGQFASAKSGPHSEEESYKGILILSLASPFP